MGKKICCVVQRYGLEVNGGAELHSRLLAEKLTRFYDVDVVTTKAIDYMTWENEYVNDEEMINGVRVLRFPVDYPRDIAEFNKINDKFVKEGLSEREEIDWLNAQGPHSSALIHFLISRKDHYDCFIFFTYLYYQTCFGIGQVKEKAILVPDAHDEPYIYMKIFKKVFNCSKGLFFNTDDERQLVRNLFKNYHIRCRVGGAGVEVPETCDPNRFRTKYNLDRYIIYIGRVDYGKNVPSLIEMFDQYKKEHDTNLKLVLIGKNVCGVEKSENIIPIGFVSEQDKYDALSGAEFLVLPSKYESLSIVVLEAFALKKPVVVNGECQVLKTHCERSRGGLYYKDYKSFDEAISYFEENRKELDVFGMNGYKYVEKYYQWDAVVKKLTNLIEYVSRNSRK